jgi:hypothetical protein
MTMTVSENSIAKQPFDWSLLYNGVQQDHDGLFDAQQTFGISISYFA